MTAAELHQKHTKEIAGIINTLAHHVRTGTDFPPAEDADHWHAEAARMPVLWVPGLLASPPRLPPLDPHAVGAAA